MNTSGIMNSSGVSCSGTVWNSSGVHNSNNISASIGISSANNTYHCCGVMSSSSMFWCFGAHNSMFCSCCNGISFCIFCYETSGAFKIFNKEVSETRFNEVETKLSNYYWNAVFMKSEELGVNISNSLCEAYSSMPDDMREYIKSLPEYDEEIFKKITEG